MLPIHKNKKTRYLFDKFQIPFAKIVAISIGISLLNIIIVILLQGALPPEIPLFYGLAEGEEQLSTSLGLIIPGLFSLFINSVNIALALPLQNDFLQKTLVLTALAVSIISLITSVEIIFLVGSF